MYTVHIASRALEAAGAWYTSATPHALRGNWREGPNSNLVSVLVTYTRGAAGGYPKIRPVWTFALEGTPATTVSARDTTNNSTATVSGASITVDNHLSVVALKSLTDANPDSVVVQLATPPNATHLEIECAEVGNTGTPGTIVVAIDGEV